MSFAPGWEGVLGLEAPVFSEIRWTDGHLDMSKGWIGQSSWVETDGGEAW